MKLLCGQQDQLRRDYKPANATIISRGHDITVGSYELFFIFLRKLYMVVQLKNLRSIYKVSWKGDAGKISINGTDYNLQHSHWHVPSEHTINGKKYVLFAFSHRL